MAKYFFPDFSWRCAEMSWFFAIHPEFGQNKRPGKPDLLKFISAISASTSVVKDAKTNYF
ncbi:hypothetical protein CU103_12695 [Phyllobacterium sophorae]|jgi:hypothetical protein|uniref:Uncharacterized protein n=1 Tax=Phyllobacterium sophorae TaxID=1520277 RepID=A0A2P7BBR0_9HYPH|nr:hypothetical protein CU103_12695 [Phyllobacterium sophorae]